MDSIHSFKGYGKVDAAEDREFQRKTRKRLIIIGVSSVLFLLIIIGVVIGVVVSRQGYDDDGQSPSPSSNLSQSIKAVCSVTLHPNSCYSSLLAATSANATTDPEELFKLSLEIAMAALEKIKDLPQQLAANADDKMIKGALDVCSQMIDDSIDSINDSLSSMQPVHGQKILTESKISDLRTWLSAVITNQETCLDALDGVEGDFRRKLEDALKNPTEFASNSLAIVSKILSLLKDFNIPIHRKLLLAPHASDTGMPYWVVSDTHRRRLLQGSTRPSPNVTVAQDGSGLFETIMEALKLVPKKSPEPFVIYVKAGKYVEDVIVDKKKWNVFMFGDGANKTIVSGRKNVVDGTPTFRTAPFIVEGRGFMAMDMGFENTAGPEKHQAVAVRTKADHAIFYRCAFDAYQDTLYAHSQRQFFRECDIRGTIDFIFGDAAVVFQNCIIRPRQPLANQRNTITAQGKKDPNENTGISIQECKITPFDNVTVPTYLGRPWKVYSTTVFMESVIERVVHPKGWLSWDGKTDPPATIFYAEYQNSGPGSSTMDRVKWDGYKPSLSSREAQRFTVATFIQGGEWLQGTGVSFTL